MFRKISLTTLAIFAVGCSSEFGIESSEELTANQLEKDKLSLLTDVVVKNTLEEISIEVKKPESLARMVNNGHLVAIDGVIVEAASLSKNENKELQRKTSCKFVSTRNKSVSKSYLKDLVLNVTASHEIPVDTEFGVARHIFIVTNQDQFEIGCTKYKKLYDDFTWYEVQKALGKLIRVGKISS